MAGSEAVAEAPATDEQYWSPTPSPASAGDSYWSAEPPKPAEPAKPAPQPEAPATPAAAPAEALAPQPVPAQPQPTATIGPHTPTVPDDGMLTKAWKWMNTPVNIGKLRATIAQQKADSEAPPTIADSNHPWTAAIRKGLEGFGADAAGSLLTPLSAALAGAGTVARGAGAAAQLTRAGLVATGLGFGANAVHDAVKNGVVPNPKLGEKGYDDPAYLKRALMDAAMVTGGATGVADTVHPVNGEYGARGVYVGGEKLGVDVGYRPKFRVPNPDTGSYAEADSTVVPGKVHAGVNIGERRFGTKLDVTPSSPEYWSAQPPKPEPKALSAGGAPKEEAPPAVGPSAAGTLAAARAKADRIYAIQVANHPEWTGQKLWDETNQFLTGAEKALLSARGKLATIDSDLGRKLETASSPEEIAAYVSEWRANRTSPGRPVVQASDNPDAIRTSAAQQEPTLNATVQGALANVDGAEVVGSRVKDGESQQNKADREKPVETQKDHLGVRVSAETPAAAKQAEQALAKDHKVVGSEPLDNNGLEGRQVFVQTGKPGDANQVSEVQILPAEQVKVLDETDPLYDQQKKALAAGDKAKAGKLAEQITEIHQDALGREKPKPNRQDALADFMTRVGTRLAREAYGQGILDDMEDRGESPRDISKQFWEKTYFDMPAEAQQAMQKQLRALTSMQPGDTIMVRADKSTVEAKDWQDVATVMDLPDTVEHLEGGERGYVAMMRDAIDRFGTKDARSDEKQTPALAGKSGEEGGRGESPEPAGEAAKPAASTAESTTMKTGDRPSPRPADFVPERDLHKLQYVPPEDAPAEVQQWDKDQAAKWTGGKPSLQVVSETTEQLDPAKLKTTQPWASDTKLKRWQTQGMGTAGMPAVEVLRTPDGDYIVDGVHRATVAQRAGETVTAKVYTVKAPAETKPAAAETKPAKGETKYDFGNTQHDIAADSDAAKALAAMRDKIAPEDLQPSGYGGNDKGLEDEPHVTLRYGIQGDDTSGIRKYLEQQAPFEAKLGKVTSFPPSAHSKGGAPLIAEVHAPELHRMNAEIEKHGDFTEPSFPDYKPHATVAYVKPEAVDKYKGDATTEGKTFRVDSISISDRNGNKEVVKLGGAEKPSNEVAKQEVETEDPWQAREKEIARRVKESKADGATHVDQLPYGVETMRGVHFRSLRDGKGGTIETVTNHGSIYAQYDDGTEENIGRKEAEEWVVDGHRSIKLDRKAGKYVVSGPIPKSDIKGIPLPTGKKFTAREENPEAETNQQVSRETTPARITKGATVTLPDGTSGSVAWTMGGKARVRVDDGSRRDVPLKDLKLREVEGVTSGTPGPIGAPISARVEQIKRIAASGTPVRIFTVRAGDPQVPAWLKEHGLGNLPVTNVKGLDFGTLLDNQVNAPSNKDTPFKVPPIPAGKALYVDLDGTIAYTTTHEPIIDSQDGGNKEEEVRQRGTEAVESRGEEAAGGSGAKGGNAKGELRPEEHREEVSERTVHADSNGQRVGGRAQGRDGAALGAKTENGGARSPQESRSARQSAGEPRGDSGDAPYKNAREEQNQRSSASVPIREAGTVGEGSRSLRDLRENFSQTRQQRAVRELLLRNEAAGKEGGLAPPPASAQPVALEPGQIGRASLSDLKVDPKRFQYKLNTDSTGSTNKLKDVPWNDSLSGIVTVWRDPEDGQTYVVNGHHRYDLARRHGAGTIAVRMAPAEVKTAQDARILGALQNIAEGNGTAVDAAKFLRDTSYTPAELSRYGVSLTGPIAEDGAALARLDPKLFDDVVAGRIPERRGVAIGNAAETPAQQEALLKLIHKTEAKGRTVTNATIEELGRMVKGAHEVTQTTGSLFGTEVRTNSTAIEKAEVSAYIRSQLSQEKKLFGSLTSTAKAQTLERAKNKINTEENATVASRAEQAQEIYDRLSTRTGPVDDILNQAAKRIARGENASTAKSDAYRAIRTAVSEALRGGQEASGRSAEEDVARPEAPEQVNAPALPGMETDVAQQRESAAEVRDENQRTAVEGSLTSPKGDISRAAGEMERESPLFHGTGAGGNQTLFGDEPVKADGDASKKAADLGSTFYSGFADPELFKRLFPSIAERVGDWIADRETPADQQRAMMRETRGTMDRRVAAVMHKLSDARKEWTRRPREDSMAFWNAVESGKTDSLPAADRALADLFKGAFDQMKGEIQQLKPEALQNYIENYFPHLWERPAAATQLLKGLMTGRTPFAGRASFLKKRTIPTMQDGIDLGLKPKTWNPVESFLLKYAEMAQFLMGHQTLQAMKDAGTSRFVAIGQKAPDGWTQLDDRIGTVYGNPHIPVTEYYDKQVWAALQETARNMLVSTTRKMNIGGTRLGYFSRLDGIVTKTATPLDVVAHELGHAIDEAYGLKQQLVKDKQFKQELRDLADLRFEGGDPSPYYKKYVRKGEEKIAAIFQAYVHTPERLQEVAPNTYRHIREFLGQHEELEPLLNLKRGMTHEARQDTVYAGGIVTTGHYYAPADAARVFNNFVSRGLAGRSGVYDTINWMNQNLNALQLGISAFHAATTSINAATSDVALAIQQLAEGKPLKAGASLIKGAAVAPSILSTVVNGSRLMQEYLSPGSYAKFAEEATALADAGGRIRQNTIDLKPMDRTINAWRNGAVVEGLTHLPAALMEYAIRPVMEYYVPRMKAGAFYAMAHDILDNAQRNGWTQEKTRAKMQEAWDSIDNRFGQVVYDNLFWNKAMRDALQLSVRSVGWNFGDVRELGGGVKDAAQAAGKAAQGEVPEVTPRMAFTLALPMVSALIGGVLTYVWTKHKPETWKDYFYPRTADGTRHSIPGYMKDVFAFGHAPVQTTLNKMAPIWSLTAEAINNRDFYGTEIRHKDDPFVKQLSEFASWAGRQAVPFSFSSGAKLLQDRGAEPKLASMLHAAAKHPGDVVLGQLGFQSAPAYIQSSPALNAARDYERENNPPGTHTKQQSDHTAAFRAVVKMYRTGQVDHDQVERYRKEGMLPGNSVARAAMESRYSPLVVSSRQLSLEQILNVYDIADEQEQKQLRPLIGRKAHEVNGITDTDKRQEVAAALDRALNHKASTEGVTHATQDRKDARPTG